MLEVELKASLEDLDIVPRLEALGFAFRHRLAELDTYFKGVDRDFAQTDEALRLRRCRILPDGAEETLLTYKGPKAPGPVKSRTEYETAVADGETMDHLLTALGYAPLRQVEKVRTEYTRAGVTACLDEVTGLGSFLELELLVEAEDQAAAAEQLLSLLDELNIPRKNLTRQSYLGALLAKG